MLSLHYHVHTAGALLKHCWVSHHGMCMWSVCWSVRNVLVLGHLVMAESAWHTWQLGTKAFHLPPTRQCSS